MKLDLGKKTGLLVVCIGVAIVAATAWRLRNTEWLQQLLQVDGPAKVNIKFDNGSVRDVQAVRSPEQSSKRQKQPSSENAIGKPKKCLHNGEVIYTDQLCPVDARVAPITGGNVTVVGAIKTKPETPTTGEPGPKALREALDLSGNENLREKMIERAINR